MGPSRKLPSGIKDLNRAGSSLRTFFTETKSSQFPCRRNQERKAQDQ